MKISNSQISFRANKMSEPQAKLIEDTLKNAKNIDIICHDVSDRDTANCAYVMWNYLNQMGINSRVVLSQKLSTLNLRDENFNYTQSKDLTNDDYKNVDTVLCLDFSSKGRINKYARKLTDNSKAFLCIDHHVGCDIHNKKPVVITKTLLDSKLPKRISPIYIDTSAKSATSIIYRYFEVLNKEIDENCAYDLLAGLVSDCKKKDMIVCDGTRGEIIPQKELKDDKNAYEIFLKLKSKLTPDKILKLARETDILSSLTNEEKEFQKNLYKRLQYNDLNKTAYVVIPPNDEEWEKLGKDNNRTSAILNSFRREIIKNDKYKTNTAIVFYEADGCFRLSLHSKNNNLEKFYYNLSKVSKYRNYPDFSIGGHKNRGGGKIATLNKETCAQFVEDVIKCAL